MERPRIEATPGDLVGLAARTILVVEDDDLVREMIVTELDEAGYVVFEAACAEEALTALDERPIGILFTDIRMPGTMDGWALAEEVRRRRPMLPVLYASGYSAETPRLVPDSLFMRKPYRPSEVLAAIEKLAAPKS